MFLTTVDPTLGFHFMCVIDPTIRYVLTVAPEPNIVEVVHFDVAEEFFNALQPTAEPWRSNPEAWIYRGHADAQWKLVPSVNRRAHLRKFLSNVPEPARDELYWEPTYDEATGLLLDFKDALDRAGFKVPGEPSSMPSGFIESSYIFDEQMQQIAALAQHHGIPTWLLDWTRYSTFAAYFAASDVVHAPEAPGSLAVWALNIVDGQSPSARMSVFDERVVFLSVVQSPRAGNPNLHAQAGIFTFGRKVAMTPAGTDKVSVVSVDELVAGSARENDLKLPLFYKYTLPRSEAGALLKWLARVPVTGASLFPGLDGVARDVRDRRRWPMKQQP
jgi:hypothetical protein